MHELSIATSLLDLARRHVPPGAVLLSVNLRVGPMRGIEPHAMDFAWKACIAGTDEEGSSLEIEFLPWQLRCRDCGTQFSSDHPYASCGCGSMHAHPVGGDELQIISIDVEEDVSSSACRLQPACPSDAKR